jgi:para-nitrobenzyl esterase
MVSPQSKFLFHRAILQSGPTLSIIPLEAAAKLHQAFGDTIGCPGTSRATAHCLRSLPASEILHYQGTESANSRFVTGPLLDGTLVPLQPDTAFATGQFNRVPVMIGSTRDEISFTESIYEYFFGRRTAAGYDSALTLTYGVLGAGPGGTPPPYPPGTVQRIENHYPLSAYASPALALTAIGSNVLACRVRQLNMRLSRWVPVYAYEFTYQNAPWYFPPLSFPVGASHTIDIQFLFPLWHGGQGIVHPLDAREQRLSDKLVDFWTTFARDGNPNGDSRNQPWPRYVAARRNYLVQDIPHLSLLTGPEFSRVHKCGFWDTVLLY